MSIVEYENFQEKKVHGAAAFPYTTYPCSIPLDFSRVPMHWHDEMEIVYVKKGEGMVVVDFVEYGMGAGDVLVILPGQLHSIEQKRGCSMEYENIIFQLDMLFPRQEDLCVSEYFLPFLRRQLEVPVYLTGELDFYGEAVGCLDWADWLCGNRPGAYQLSVKAQLFQFFFILFSHSAPVHPDRPPAKSRSLDKAKLILTYIEDHYMENLTIKEMAQVCGFSQSHFMKFFKSVFGASFISYLREYRLTMASRLLLSSSSSVLTIAQETGFDNLSYFNRSFKSMFGVTPRQFREGSHRSWEGSSDPRGI